MNRNHIATFNNEQLLSFLMTFLVDDSLAKCKKQCLERDKKVHEMKRDHLSKRVKEMKRANHKYNLRSKSRSKSRTRDENVLENSEDDGETLESSALCAKCHQFAPQTETSAVVDWVQCGVCARWYHHTQKCMGDTYVTNVDAIDQYTCNYCLKL
jgi:hypothetical protein